MASWRSWLPSRRFLSERDRVPLPPPILRAAGPLFQDDAQFRAFATRDVALMRRHCDLKGKSILDFGCGVGRLYFGLQGRDEPAFYLGVDVKRDVIDWARRHIGRNNPRYSFAQANVRNERYNPDGADSNTAWSRLLNRRFDVIYCYSVLSHMTEADAATVLNVFARHMADDAVIFLTAFAGGQAEDVEVNPKDMPIEMVGPLHVVRYRRHHLVNALLREFDVVAELVGVATDGQSFFVLKRRKADPLTSRVGS